MPHRGISGNTSTVSWDVSTGNEFKNNIVFNDGGLYGTSRSYNLYDTSALASGETAGQYFSLSESALFVDPTNYDYTLKIATDAGDSSIGSEFGTDMLEIQRDIDGNWDRGAYEYVGDETVAPPTNLKIVEN